MYEIPWSKPVIVTLLDGRCRTVVGPLDAITCLQCEWPVRDGAYYGCAMRACNAALRHLKKPEEARTAFLAASREAFLTVVSGTQQEERGDGNIFRE
jgi:hypothetical protein